MAPPQTSILALQGEEGNRQEEAIPQIQPVKLWNGPRT
jgi:hypothetical protein